MTLKKKFVAAALIFIFLDIIAMAVLLSLYKPAAQISEDPLPILYPVPPFTLTDSTGNDFSRKDLNGKNWVVDFFFTSCAGPCPIMSSNITKLAKAFDEKDNIKFLSITVDPETDNPERLHAYGKQYQANFNQWHFLTGPIEKINTLAREGFKLGSGGEPTLHADRFVLVDTNGNIRAYYTGTDPADIAKLKTQINRLLKDPTS